MLRFFFSVEATTCFSTFRALVDNASRSVFYGHSESFLSYLMLFPQMLRSGTHVQ